VTTERFWTLANTVSLSRVLLAALFVVTPSAAGRLGLLALAGFTDVADGWIARWRGGGSRWGALIDPVADRAFAIIAVGALAWDGALSPVAVFVLLFRDLMTAIGLFVARRMPSLTGVTFLARPSGKAVTIVQFVAMVVAIMAPERVVPFVVVVGAVSLYSVVDYTLYLQRERVARRSRDKAP
jgi:CDP-diacylglycerol--glycerol-3-phosphate 3-phosphatidyltransferase/cardiolipin synthase